MIHLRSYHWSLSIFWIEIVNSFTIIIIIFYGFHLFKMNNKVFCVAAFHLFNNGFCGIIVNSNFLIIRILKKLLYDQINFCPWPVLNVWEPWFQNNRLSNSSPSDTDLPCLLFSCKVGSLGAIAILLPVGCTWVLPVIVEKVPFEAKVVWIQHMWPSTWRRVVRSASRREHFLQSLALIETGNFEGMHVRGNRSWYAESDLLTWKMPQSYGRAKGRE